MFSFFAQDIKPIIRNFSPAYLLDKNAQEKIKTEGYAILENIYTDTELNNINSFYNEIKLHNGFNVKTKFESSGNFISIELQNRIFKYIEQFMQKTASRFANLNNCEVGDGGAFFIKPNTNESRLEPHQDSTVIDEMKTYALFIWIPLVDIDNNNGALYVLPKSHLWGNCYRSQHIKWAFKKCYKELWKYMHPLYLKKGSLVVFDSSIIHASEINKSKNERVALCGALLPKHHQKVEYLKFYNKILQYNVDENYWKDGGQIKSLEKYTSTIIECNFPKSVNIRQLQKLLK